MKALSIQQPWAWAILHAGKDIENRNWPTKFRGYFLIHTGKKFDYEGYKWLAKNANRFCFQLPEIHDFKMGGIIGRAKIVDCVENHGSRWFFGKYGFVIKYPKPITFYPLKGKLGFWEENSQ